MPLRPGQDLRVLVVDDTVVYRKVLRGVVESLPGMVVAGAAVNGRIALDKMRQAAVDVVLLDLEMPEMDGIATLEQIRTEFPEVGVVMISGVNRNAANLTLQALELGALDFVPKPAGDSAAESREDLVMHLGPILRSFSTKQLLGRAHRRAARITDVLMPLGSAAAAKAAAKAVAAPARPAEERPAVERPAAERPNRTLAPLPRRIAVVVIGISTGGPKALTDLIPALPGDLAVPVLVVQHMPPLFTASLAQTLNRRSALEVREAADGDPILPGQVLIAPGGRHMVVRSRRDEAGGLNSHVVGLNDNPPEHSCRPAVDVLFRSVAANYGGEILALVMTGMGEDGQRGVAAMKQRGCRCLTQDEDSCVIYGMPKAVVDAGLSDEQLSLGVLAGRVTRLVGLR
jgi:two-component system, chemotaxis family, protein-glutamate methylesterase/glutaminase